MYEYRPGPFMNAYIRAIKNPDEKVVLIIEEINRANPAAVFGDILQLLDRDKSGESEYEINTSEDLKSFITSELLPVFRDSDQENVEEVAIIREKAKYLKLPRNLHIWGTMNRADESVNFIDAAFLRRWKLFYLPYSTKCDGYGGTELQVNEDIFEWDEFRRRINSVLSKLDVEDDKFIGPYFLRQDETEDKQTIFSKLLTYLWHDVIPMQRPELFTENSLAQVYEKWMENGKVLKI